MVITKVDVSIEIRKSRAAIAQLDTDTNERGVAVLPREELRAQALKAAIESLRDGEQDEVDEVRVKLPQRNGGAEFRFKWEELKRCAS